MHRTIGLSGEQLRAARALARIEQADLAKWTRLSVETIKRLERIRGQVNANVRTLNAIGEAFEALGIRFESESGLEGVWRAAHEERSDRRAPAAAEARHRLVFQGPVSAYSAEQLRRGAAPPGLAGFALDRKSVV
jgi:transcriptional regulator with XRE-family HTH domain